MYLTSIRRRTRKRQMEVRMQSGKERPGRGDAETQRIHWEGSFVCFSIPIYTKTIIRAKEAVLQNNLFTLRTVIDNYTYDKQKAPQQLQDLVSDGYLQKIPMDPMTGNNQSWRVTME